MGAETDETHMLNVLEWDCIKPVDQLQFVFLVMGIEPREGWVQSPAFFIF